MALANGAGGTYPAQLQASFFSIRKCLELKIIGRCKSSGKRGLTAGTVGMGWTERVATPAEIVERGTDYGAAIQRAAASALSTGLVLKAMAASGACCRIRLTTFSKNGSIGSGLRIPPPTTTQA